MTSEKKNNSAKTVRGNPDKTKPFRFNKRPDFINKKGAPRKTISAVNIELEGLGYTTANQRDIVDCYMRLINIDIPKLTEIIKDDSQPAMVRIVGKSIISGKGFDVIEKMLDRTIGKTVETIDIKTTRILSINPLSNGSNDSSK